MVQCRIGKCTREKEYTRKNQHIETRKIASRKETKKAECKKKAKLIERTRGEEKLSIIYCW